ncbi:hypothetical protein LAZ67_16002939 [Cordylochernes scorpioides]|uniref:Major facilitator superfamily (MFS) profile domain-containing protein n=1 Tax=Cordylochernes scorpioides TaxID=51811 RepID=A0ABY6LEH5_9ARAC|nr:hypothetical protein LAZ67_16002939 [Cordylochernes scorpioides]
MEQTYKQCVTKGDVQQVTGEHGGPRGDYGTLPRSTDQTDYYFAQNLLTDERPAQEDTEAQTEEEPCPVIVDGKKKAKRNWRQWIVFCSLAYGNLAIGACISLQAPFFPKEAERKGASPSQYGLIFGVYQLTMFFCAPICGSLTEELAERMVQISYTNPKTMLNTGMTIVGTAAVVFGLLDRLPAGAPFIGMAFFIRILEGTGSAAVKTGMYTYIAMKFTDSVATTFATLETFLGIGLIIGPTVGGLLYDVGGYQLPFFIVGSITVVVSFINWCILDSGEQVKTKRGDLIKFYSNFGVFLYALIVFTTFTFIGFNQATLEPHLRQVQTQHSLNFFLRTLGDFPGTFS